MRIRLQHDVCELTHPKSVACIGLPKPSQTVRQRGKCRTSFRRKSSLITFGGTPDWGTEHGGSMIDEESQETVVLEVGSKEALLICKLAAV